MTSSRRRLPRRARSTLPLRAPRHRGLNVFPARRRKAFLAFAAQRAAALPGAPTKLAIQYRSWDYAADLDKAHYCDSMVVLALDVAAETVAASGPEPCDFVDWAAETDQTMGTL